MKELKRHMFMIKEAAMSHLFSPFLLIPNPLNFYSFPATPKNDNCEVNRANQGIVHGL